LVYRKEEVRETNDEWKEGHKEDRKCERKIKVQTEAKEQ
jgi:hypothetical protein